ncbi:hypothetical protein [Antarcticirhabdus aurantiaca]|uniref:Uncharacterized protein n=1 Tax=Antarcticirhabdus aurantiaca TaxID=2606717 RepID=A0ACD4NRD5_9HYPH|nr:hypothetical protein [Antarcticirhabdus aurantiaca]WAJ29453.1 hypothetical protein OXU80_04230 [Jeongeuplla avenae]
MNNDRLGGGGRGTLVTVRGQGSHDLARAPVARRDSGLGYFENRRNNRQRALDHAEIVREVDRRKWEQAADVELLDGEARAEEAKLLIVGRVFEATGEASEQIRALGGDTKRRIVEATGDSVVALGEAGTRIDAKISSSDMHPAVKGFAQNAMAGMMAAAAEGIVASGYEAIRNVDRKVDSINSSRFAPKD